MPAGRVAPAPAPTLTSLTCIAGCDDTFDDSAGASAGGAAAALAAHERSCHRAAVVRWLQRYAYVTSVKEAREYVRSFADDGFDSMPNLMDATEAQLVALKVKTGHRNRILRHAKDWTEAMDAALLAQASSSGSTLGSAVALPAAAGSAVSVSTSSSGAASHDALPAAAPAAPASGLNATPPRHLSEVSPGMRGTEAFGEEVPLGVRVRARILTVKGRS